jgi:putative transposase
MSRNYKIQDPDKANFISFATVYWIDVFSRKSYKDMVVDSIIFCINNKGLEVFAWCIMPSHVHLIIRGRQGKLEDIIRDLKRHTAKAVLKAIEENPQESRKEWMLWMFKRAGERNPNNSKYQFWQQHNQPIELFNAKVYDQKINYLHKNPVEEGFVENPWEYLYSSARDYAGSKGLVPLAIDFNVG